MLCSHFGVARLPIIIDFINKGCQMCIFSSAATDCHAYILGHNFLRKSSILAVTGRPEHQRQHSTWGLVLTPERSQPTCMEFLEVSPMLALTGRPEHLLALTGRPEHWRRTAHAACLFYLHSIQCPYSARTVPDGNLHSARLIA